MNLRFYPCVGIEDPKAYEVYDSDSMAHVGIVWNWLGLGRGWFAATEPRLILNINWKGAERFYGKTRKAAVMAMIENGVKS